MADNGNIGNTGYEIPNNRNNDTLNIITFNENDDVNLNITNTSLINVTKEPCSNDYCLSDEDYLNEIEGYIFPTAFEWVLIVLYLYVFLVGLIGNSLVFFAVMRNRHMRTVTNFFIVNLATADFMVILICLPPTVFEDVTETWYMGKVMCKAVKYLQVSPFNLKCVIYVYRIKPV